MLDTATKRRIDTARDILVGKVPDPKSQVEQITIALIYKFMDDMDTESAELGGERSFFVGEFARYGWTKMMGARLGGHELLALYSEGITKMTENPGLPLLFRDIFKNAYLPYRDPETLKAFLKIIDEFTYDHSERLGDAFEYLLSVLGSQGDAGQFRTPRHIIDFMVSIIDPKKNETILDPACGTAGFLISAYKHVLRANSSPDAVEQVGGDGEAALHISKIPTARGDLLTPDDRERLAGNIKGYDISPDMIRLSLVNLYLHGINDPHIFEYDTLTSDDRWNDYADVILANPPFMSPKGGIRPHNRFSVQSKRSEVLFVDYMAEHLTPNGRAAIIVPEGIIFQSQNAYKQLRKMLVEEYLVAVVSLPAGVFNPYSGVKTSILILDKSLAKQSDTVGFFKVENDGFGLGAQRREIKGEQLTETAAEIAEYLRRLQTQESVEDFSPALGLIVPKEKVAANGDYNLSAERYREYATNSSTFPLMRLEQVFTEIRNGVNVTQLDQEANFRVSRIQTISDGSINLAKTKFTNDAVKPEFFLKWGDILLSHINSIDHLGKTAIFLNNDESVVHGINLIRLQPDISQIDPLFAIRVFKTKRFIDNVKSFAQKAVNQASVKTSDLRAIEIPLPPLEVQKEIVAEIEGYQKVIDGARAVLDHYRPHIPINPEWPMVQVKDVCRVNPQKSEIRNLEENTTVSFVPMADLGMNCVDFTLQQSKTLSEVGASYTYFCENDVLVAKVTPCFENGKAGIARGLKNGIGFGSSEFIVLRPLEHTLAEWVFGFITTPAFRITATAKMTGTGGLQRVPREVFETYKIPLPPMETQRQIVAEIEAEQQLVGANRELIERMEKKIAAAIARVWGEEPAGEQETLQLSPLNQPDPEQAEELPIACETPGKYGRDQDSVTGHKCPPVIEQAGAGRAKIKMAEQGEQIET